MTQRKDTALAHPVDPSKWARIRQAERVTYPSAVAAPSVSTGAPATRTSAPSCSTAAEARWFTASCWASVWR